MTGPGDAVPPPLHLPASLRAWGGTAFQRVFERECSELDPGQLPLHQAMTYGSRVVSDNWSLMYIGASADPASIHVKAGIFFGSLIAGCSCADDPTPLEVGSEYCQVLFSIDRRDGRTEVRLCDD